MGAHVDHGRGGSDGGPRTGRWSLGRRADGLDPERLGVGLAYPGLFLRATTEGPSLKATQLAAAVITTESFGGLIGSSAGAALASVSGSLGISRGDALALAYVGFSAVLAAAVIAATRSLTPEAEKRS